MIACFKPTFLRFDSLDSTNLEAMRRAGRGAPEGLCIVAREQTRGRGRLDRSWYSPKDAGLYFSAVLRPKLERKAWPLISLMAALAVSDALVDACNLRPDIKWPNDIFVNDHKLAGVLAETVETNQGTAIILGIGINLNRNSVPAEMAPQATSVETFTGTKPDYEATLQEVAAAIGDRYDFLQSPGGPEHTIREWCSNSSYALGRRVHVSLGKETFDGTTRGLERDGALRVETDTGKIRVVRAGDVTALRATKL